MKLLIRSFVIIICLTLVQCKTKDLYEKGNWVLYKSNLRNTKKEYNFKSDRKGGFVLLNIKSIKNNLRINSVTIGGAQVLDDDSIRTVNQFFKYRKILCDESGNKKHISKFRSYSCSLPERDSYFVNEFISKDEWHLNINKDTLILKNDSVKLVFISKKEFLRKWYEDRSNKVGK